jgi:type IX secretion system PorP/SprF family membrane protein
MVKKLIYTLLLFLLLIRLPLVGQDPQFTQFYANKLYLAPSFAGATKQSRIGTIYRNQWSGIPGGFNTIAFSFDHYFANFNSGLGLLLVRDMAGSGRLGFTNVGVQYSYDFQINDYLHIRPGMHFMYTRYGIDFYKLKFFDQINGNPTSFEDPPENEGLGAADAAVSALVYTDKLWIGSTVDHLFRPNEGFYSNKAIVPIKVSIFGGYQLMRQGRLLRPIDETLSVAFMYRQQKDKKQLDLGLYWNKAPVVLGFWYRGIPLVNSERGDALAALVGFKMEGFSLGYSYDFTISNLINSTHGAHEVSLVYEFTTSRKKKIHAIPCPEF